MDGVSRLKWSGLLLLAMSACAPPAGEIAAVSQSLGEPTNGFPSLDERLGIMAINRARSSPTTVKGPASTDYAARAPVQLSYPLSRSSRFHAINMSKSGASLMHYSPCTLATNVATSGCDGDPSCACVTGVGNACKSCADVDPIMNGCASSGTGNGTKTFTRIAYFTSGTTTDATGEVAAAGYQDPFDVVDGWMDEPAGDDGHRTNLLDVGITSTVMGYGHADGGCYDTFDVSDSGDDSALVPSSLPTAAVRPARGPSGTFTFYASWADAGGAPGSINVVIDGACTAMTKEFGSDTLNATYKVAVPLTSGCHTYRVVAHTASGAAKVFPTGGEITISVGSGACADEWSDTIVAATCDAAGGSDLASGNHDLGSASDLSGGPVVIPDDGGDVDRPQPPRSRDSGCAHVPGSTSGAGVVLMLIVLALLTRRRALG
jgi:MYXO-CTERM domain-containing protein